MMKVGNECDNKSSQKTTQFVDESAIEIDIADDDDDVCEDKEKRDNCSNILGNLRHRRDDESVENATVSNTGASLQSKAAVSNKVVEKELILTSHRFKSQLCPQKKKHPNLSFHELHKDGRRYQEKVQKVPNDCDVDKSQFVDESAVEIDVADDDSSDSVVVIADDSDNDMDSRSSLADSLNLVEDTAGIRHNVSDLQENIPSKQACSDIATSRKASPDNAVVSLDKVTPTVSHSQTIRRSKRITTSKSYNEDLLSEYNLQHLTTISGVDSVMFPEIVFDEFDLEHLQKPFNCGWRRELVCRRVSPKCRERMCDVYYLSPEGKKLRSKVELATYSLKSSESVVLFRLNCCEVKKLRAQSECLLFSDKNSPVNLTHFTFKRVLLFNPPFETVRLAGSRRSRRFTDRSNSPENKAQSQDCSSEGNISTKQTQDCSSEGNISTKQTATQNKFAAKNVDATDPLGSLPSDNIEFCVVNKDIAEKEDIPSDRSSTPLLNVTTPSQLSKLETSTVLSDKPSHPDLPKKCFRKRMHESSPE